MIRATFSFFCRVFEPLGNSSLTYRGKICCEKKQPQENNQTAVNSCSRTLNVLMLIRIDNFLGIDAVQCFCTSRDQPCPDPICEGSWCLVGFKNDGKKKVYNRHLSFMSTELSLDELEIFNLFITKERRKLSYAQSVDS